MIRNLLRTDKNKRLGFITFIIVISIQSCSTIQVTAIQASKADDIFSETVFALWWGGSDPVEQVDCNDNGLQFVSVKTNFFYSALIVLTLGAVVPIDVQYRCTSEPMQNGGIIGGEEE